MTRKKSEDAVSPVIGVMLMLVVVIVVGAVVTVFATGLVGDTEVAPVAKLEVEIISDEVVYGTAPGGSVMNQGTAPTLHLTHVSGDPVDTADLKLSFAWDCEVHGHHTSTYQYSEKFGSGYGTGGGVQEAFGLKSLTEIYVPANYGAYIQPLYINYGMDAKNSYGVSVMDGAYFGDHVLKRGETMMAYDLHLLVAKDGVEHAGNPAMDALFNNGKIICKFASTGEVISGMPGCPTCGEEVDGYYQCGDCQDKIWNDLLEIYPDARTIGTDDYKNANNALYSRMEEFSVLCPYCAGIDEYEQNGVTNRYPTVYEDDDGDVFCDENYGGCGETLHGTPVSTYSAGIMACLPEGTPVNVMITHIPSGQVIYEQKVFVE